MQVAARVSRLPYCYHVLLLLSHAGLLASAGPPIRDYSPAPYLQVYRRIRLRCPAAALLILCPCMIFTRRCTAASFSMPSRCHLTFLAVLGPVPRPQVYRRILTDSYESLTRGGVTRLKNVLMELRKAVGANKGSVAWCCDVQLSTRADGAAQSGGCKKWG